jgi:hypothetical protein
MEKYLQLSFSICIPLFLIGIIGMVYGQNGTTPVNNDEAFINSIWGLFLALSAGFAIVSAIAIKIATNVRDRLKNSTNENAKKIVSIIDDYVIPVLNTGNEFVNKTKDQEDKLKEFGQILYQFMGPEADKITEKPKVQIDKLTTDVTTANVQAEEYAKKVARLMALMDELKGEPEKPIAQAKAAIPPAK